MIDAIDGTHDSGDEFDDYLLVFGATSYGRFCIETGRLPQAEPWLRRAGARAEARGWDLGTARTKFERGDGGWAVGDRAQAQSLAHEAYPAIAEGLRAHDVSRCWLYFGLIACRSRSSTTPTSVSATPSGTGGRSRSRCTFIAFCCSAAGSTSSEAISTPRVERAEEARELLDSWPRHSWLQYARLDDHIGSIWRADALADPGERGGQSSSGPPN